MAIIDVHTHIVPHIYRAALERTGRLMEDGFPCPLWNAGDHLALMERAGITLSVLSVSSPHQMLGSDDEGLSLTLDLNDEMSELCRTYPDKFRFAACLPLPLVEQSAAEARRALDDLGAVAVKFPTNAGGLYPGDPKLAPLMDVLNERKAVVLLHPCKPPIYPQGCFTAKPLPLFEFLGDTTRAVINLIAQNAVEQWPNIRFVVPHMGSFLPPLIDRLSGITKVMADRGVGTPIDARKALDNFYFDLAGDSLDASIPGLLSITTPEHLMFGGDFPYTPAPMICEKVKRLASYPLLSSSLEDILSGNARRLFNL